jgi:phosphate transport system substrate-binding protein
MRHSKLFTRITAIIGVSMLISALVATAPASAASYVPITGTGSTWSQNALDQWRKNVAANYGMTVNYSGTGSSAGRRDFIAGATDFGVSEIPFQLHPIDGSPPEVTNRGYAYMPIVAGGTSFMYNLVISGQRVTNLRLSGQTISKIFTGVITNWNDAEIKSDNPKLTLPNKAILPVVRSDGSGTSAQFTLWMSKQYPSIWNSYCKKAGLSTPCGLTSQYPTPTGVKLKSQSGSNGVAGYVSQAYGEGSITYVEYSYAVKAGFPVAKVLNKAGYYIEPTAKSVAVAMLQAKINEDSKSDDYLTQILDGVYNSSDTRSYPISSYSYMIVPTETGGVFNDKKGATLGTFAHYMLCEGQQQAEALGYSPLPMNLVLAGFKQIARIPGADSAANVDVKTCNNPTFKPGDSPTSNQLAKTAPQPAACDKQGADQCATGTAGAASGSSGSGSSGTDSGSGTGTTTDPGTGNPTDAGTITDPGTSNGSNTGGGLSVGSDSLTSYTYALPDDGFGEEQITMLVAALLLLLAIFTPPMVSFVLNRRNQKLD